MGIRSGGNIMMRVFITLFFCSFLFACGGGGVQTAAISPGATVGASGGSSGTPSGGPTSGPTTSANYLTTSDQSNATSDIQMVGLELGLTSGFSNPSAATALGKFYHNIDTVELDYKGRTYIVRPYPGGYVTSTRPDQRRMVLLPFSPIATNVVDIFRDPNELEVSGYDYASLRRMELTEQVDRFGTGLFLPQTSWFEAAVGIPTQLSDMPSSATAVFTGEGYLSTAAFGSSSGTSVVTADYGAGLVDVVLADSLPLSNVEIRAENMNISGSTFTGGTVSAWDGSTPISPGLGGTAAGGFFGFDPASNGPDEVAGVIRSNNGAGAFSGSFIAD